MDVFIGGTVCFPNGWIVGTFVLFFVPSGLFCVCVPNAWIFGTFFFFFSHRAIFFFFFFCAEWMVCSTIFFSRGK